MPYKKVILTAFQILFFAFLSQSQSIYFQFSDSSNAQYTIADIRSITFSQNDMNLNLVNGSTVALPINTINSFNYTGFNTSTGIADIVRESDASIYPNPSNGKAAVTFNIPIPGKISVEFIAINGELLNSFAEQEIDAGNHTLFISASDKQGKDLPPGIYLCRISTAQNIITKKIVIK